MPLDKLAAMLVRIGALAQVRIGGQVLVLVGARIVAQEHIQAGGYAETHSPVAAPVDTLAQVRRHEQRRNC